MIDGDAGACKWQHEQISRNTEVGCKRSEERDRSDGVGADPLVPAELTRGEVRDLGEEQAPTGADRGDEGDGPQLVPPDQAPETPELRIDTTAIDPVEAAERIVAWLEGQEIDYTI